MQANEIRPWTHFRDPIKKRLFLIVDVNLTNVILMEVKDYQWNDDRVFNPMPIPQFCKAVEKGKILQPYTPTV